MVDQEDRVAYNWISQKVDNIGIDSNRNLTAGWSNDQIQGKYWGLKTFKGKILKDKLFEVCHGSAKTVKILVLKISTYTVIYCIVCTA